jgi:hypothetical protein
MSAKITFVGIGFMATALCVVAINGIMKQMPQNQPAVLKLRNNSFQTPGFIYVKMGAYKDGSSFESYTFSEGIPIKINIQQKAASELTAYTGCIEANIETKVSKGGSKYKQIQNISDFKKTDCPENMN